MVKTEVGTQIYETPLLDYGDKDSLQQSLHYIVDRFGKEKEEDLDLER